MQKSSPSALAGPATHQRSFVLNLRHISYRLLLDATREHDPWLRVWLSQDVSRRVYRFKLSDSMSGQTDAIHMSFPLSDSDDGRISVPVLERIQHCNLNMDVFVRLTNKHGETCWNQAGSVKVPMWELLELASSDRTLSEAGGRASKTYRLSVPSWGDPNSRGKNVDPEVDNDKGEIEVAFGVASAKRFLVMPDGTDVPPLTSSQVAFERELQVTKENIFHHYMGSCVAMFRKMGYTWPIVKDINAYVYQCRAGILPAAAYLGARLGGTHPKYFERAAKLVMSRHGITSAEKFDWANDPRGPAFLANVLTLAADYMCYVPDIIYLPSKRDRRKYIRKALESFDYARVRGGGDCEDLALEIVLEASELLEAASSPDASSIVLGMATLRKLYVFAMALGGVSSAEINGDYGLVKEMGAHMWSVMMLRSLWFDLWRNGNMPSDVVAPKKTNRPSSTHPVIVLEGTGFLKPEPVSSEADEESASLEEDIHRLLDAASPAAFEGMRKWFNYRRNARSPFYQTVSVLFTNEFLSHERENKYVCFAVCSRSNRTGASPTTGVPFDAFVRGETGSMCLWSEPPINSVESACIRDSMKDLYPMPPLDPSIVPGSSAAPSSLPLPGRSEEERHEAILRRMCQRIKGAPLARGEPGTCRVEYFLKSALVSQTRADAIASACEAIGSDVIRRVECHREEVVSNRLAGWRLVFSCKPKSSEETDAAVRRFRKRRALLEGASGSDEPEADDTY